MSRWLIAVLVLGVAGYLVWMLWPRSQSSESGVTIQEIQEIQEAAPAQTATARPMSSLALEEIQPEMVSYMTQQNGRWVLNFLDGSKREVYPFEMDQLPEQLKFQMGYQRGGGL